MEKVRINYYTGRNLMMLPGIGNELAEHILDLLHTRGNITKEILATLFGVKNPNDLLGYFDFTRSLCP